MARILVMDDEEIMSTVLSKILKRNNHEVRIAPHGIDGLKVCQETEIDVAFVDINMPIMDGLETIFNLQEEYPDIGIIAMTGGGKYRLDFLLQEKGIGAIVTLNKPFRMQEVLEAVNQVMD